MQYHPFVSRPIPRKPAASLTLDTSLLKPGLRLAVGLSGGADSVALVRALAARSEELGLVLHAAHLHHGLRGDEADGDLAFCRELAAKLGLPFHEARVDTAAEARADRKSGKSAETIEEAARRLRYSWFRTLMSEIPLHAVATAHTLDDQAETVLAKFLRGAWTEGLAGIAPVLEFPEGRVVRPLLAVTRAEIEAYLRGLGQDWREDSTNRHLTFTRNRIRHELLPLLEGWNPRLREHLAQMAAIARDEEVWWQAELARLAPQMLLPGRPARGGGRAGWRGPGSRFGAGSEPAGRTGSGTAKTIIAPCRRAVWRCARFCRNRSAAVNGTHGPCRAKAGATAGVTRRTDSAGDEALGRARIYSKSQKRGSASARRN